MSMERLELSTEGYRIPVAVLGEGERCLVCVNAAQQTMSAWIPLAKRFAVEAGYRVILFDFPNQGRGETIPAALDLCEQADVVRGVIRDLAPGGCADLCGASWGALVAATCAARHPAAVRRLMLGSFQVRTSARLDDVSARCVRLIELGGRREMAELFITEFGAGLPAAFREAMRAQFARLSDSQLLQMHTQCMALAGGADLRQVVDLDRIAADVLIVNGADDPLIDAPAHHTTARCFPKAEWRIVPDVGHFLHLEQPRVIDIYLEFVRPPDRLAIAA